jgi:hypothetical protein
MSKCAFFVSAPTVRFLQVMRALGLLPQTQRRRVAADVYSAIKPLVGTLDIDELRRAAQSTQDERWKMISRGIGEITDPGFARVAVAEQWMLAQIELVRGGAPVKEALAEKRAGAIEQFIRDNLSFEAGEVIHLHALASLQRHEGGGASKSAA